MFKFPGSNKEHKTSSPPPPGKLVSSNFIVAKFEIIGGLDVPSLVTASAVTFTLANLLNGEIMSLLLTTET